MQTQFCCAAFDFSERDLVKQRNWILIELRPTGGIEIAKQADAVVVPTPAEISSDGPETLLNRSNEAVQGARLADHRRDLVCGFAQHADFMLSKDPRLLCLNDQNALQNAAVDERDAEEGVIYLFARFLEVFKAGVIAGVLHGHGLYLLRNQAGEALAERHAQGANASRVKAEGRG